MLADFKVVKTIETKPIGLILHAKGGLGKTTFGAEAVLDAKNGIMFQCGEDGLSDLTDKRIKAVPRYTDILGMGSNTKELADTWIFFKEELIRYLMIKDHGYDLLFFDNFDNLIVNNLNWYVIQNFYKSNEGDANSWGGKKLHEMDSELSLIIKAFEYLQKKGISIILSTHSQQVNVRDPSVEDYKRWSLNLPGKEGANLRDRLIYWSSATLFGTLDIEVDNKKATGNKRVLKTKINPAYDAKCRFNIPETIDFDYKVFKAEIDKSKQ